MIAEKELVLKVKKHRDMMSFRSIVLEHQERIYYLIRRMVGSHEDAQDLVQDTFIKALKNIDQLRDDNKFGPWVNKLAVNMVIDFKRKKMNNGKISLSGELPPEVISDKLVVEHKSTSKNGLHRNEMASKIDRALIKLPINHREAFILFHHQKMPVKTIAVYMDCPESTVRSYIFRAIKKLKVYLKDYSESLKD